MMDRSRHTIVITGLVPVIHAACPPLEHCMDCRDQPGNDI
jgi:hypothetical protein